MIEEWRDVVGFEGFYKVSDQGNIHGPRGVTMGNPDKDGYLRMALCNHTIKKYVRIHRVVAEAFLGKNELHVNHKDSNVTNNHISNLEYVTPLDNVQHSIKFGNRKQNGEGSPRSILTENDVKLIREMREYSKKFSRKKQPFSTIWLARWFKVDSSTIYLIERKKNWSHI